MLEFATDENASHQRAMPKESLTLIFDLAMRYTPSEVFATNAALAGAEALLPRASTSCVTRQSTETPEELKFMLYICDPALLQKGPNPSNFAAAAGPAATVKE